MLAHKVASALVLSMFLLACSGDSPGEKIEHGISPSDYNLHFVSSTRLAVSGFESKVLFRLGTIHIKPFQAKCTNVGSWVVFDGVEGRCGALIAQGYASCPYMSITLSSDSPGLATVNLIYSKQQFSSATIETCAQLAISSAWGYFLAKQEIESSSH